MSKEAAVKQAESASRAAESLMAASGGDGDATDKIDVKRLKEAIETAYGLVLTSMQSVIIQVCTDHKVMKHKLSYYIIFASQNPCFIFYNGPYHY